MCQVYAGQPPESYEPVTRRLRLSGHSTSIRLERSFNDLWKRGGLMYASPLR